VAPVFSSADRALAARLEAADAAIAVAMAKAAQETVPNAAFEPVAGGTAMFGGVGSPMTHAMGIGMTGPVPSEEMERLEQFFRDRGSASLIDLCPMADPSVVAFVQSRPYRVIEFNNVLARRIDRDEVFALAPGVRLISEDEAAIWARVVSEGFSEAMPVSEEMLAMMMAPAKVCQCWLAGEPPGEAGAAMIVQNGVALLTGDATVPSGRGKGWQAALIRERLAAAQRQGCELAMTTVLPGSVSHRNYERAGFQLIYMRVNLMRELQEK
jgi:GNAT superfamily N-acetyltransferase